MKKLITALLLTTAFSFQAQENQKFNLGFEQIKEENELSDGWFKWGNYDLSIDKRSHSGIFAGKITSNESGSSFGSIAYKIPAKYEGKTIQLNGYMKIENVENGHAGLLLRIDGNGNALQFDNMENLNVNGTKDWRQYTITLEYPEEADNIFIAGILVGKGEVWFDDFELTIDGKNVQTLKEVEKELTNAQLDKEFDNGSLVELSDLSPRNVENLELLGRVWGFMKYHHPYIGKGEYNWDYELFRFLPDYLKNRDKKERDQYLIDWLDSFGKIEECSKCEPTDENAFLKPDLEWISFMNIDLRDKLLHIYKNRHQGDHYYIRLAANVGNPEFRHEDKYSNMPYPDDGFRLLSLYRYWNMIYYYFPYRHLMDKDWNKTLKEYIPKFLSAKNELEYEMAAIQLIGDIKDTHANLWGGADKINDWKGEFYPPIHTRFIENQLVVTDYYNPEYKSQAGLEIGDVITRINGKTIEEIIEEKSKYYPASNYATRLRDIAADVLRSKLDKIEITYLQDNTNKETTKRLNLYPRDSINIYRWYRESNEKSYKILDRNIGYITLQSIRDEDIPIIKEEFKETKGIVIDIRNYPSTFVPFKLGGYFISSPTPFVKFTNGNSNNPGEFTFTDNLEIPHDKDSYKSKLIVIVNELSQSQAEYTAMAFRAGDNTTILGSTTAGADGNVSTIFLPGGLRSMISGIGVNYPDGKETQRVGIIPDVEIKPTIKGIRDGRDELLEKAIKIILRE